MGVGTDRCSGWRITDLNRSYTVRARIRPALLAC